MSNDVATKLNTIELTGRVLGALFYYAPDSEAAAPLVAMLRQPGWETQWPVADERLPALARDMAREDDQETLEQAWQRLFIGPYALPAPPWGSVWLDRENVLFGESTLALRGWMQKNGIAHNSEMNEPEDQFGTLLMLAAWLSSEGREQALDELLAWHVFPWSERFLTQFIDGAQHPFWQALGELAQLTLATWRSLVTLPVAEHKLYR